MRQSAYYFTPGETPRSISILIWITCCVAILASLTNYLFVYVFQIPGPEDILSLSWNGINRYFFWQPITYLFVQDTAGQGINFSFLLILFLNMYILWIFGSTLQERLGTSRFFTLYFLSGILSGLTTLFVMQLTGHYMTLAGPSASLLAMFMMWTMCNPDSELLLFFFLPVKTKWLLAIVLGAIFLGSLSQGDFVLMTFYLTGTLYGYLYGLLGVGLKSPFSFTQHFDEAVIELKGKMANKLSRFRKTKKETKSENKQPDSKIYDFKSGEPIQDDDAFIDAMLTKISEYGEKSLTSAERKRMEQISARKKR